MGQSGYTIEDAPSTPATSYTIEDAPETPPPAKVSTPEQPSKLSKAASWAWRNLTPPGQVQDAAETASDYYSQQLKNRQGKTPGSPTSEAVKTFAQGAGRSISDLVGGSTSPAAVGTAGTVIAAPVVAPVVGVGMMAHGAYNAIRGWGDLKDPDVLERELNSGAEIAGGAALTAEGYKAGAPKRAAKAKEQAYKDTELSTPATKSTPFEREDVVAARPYMEAEHQASPIKSVHDKIDAYNSSISKIENKIGEYIGHNPQDVINTNPIQEVRQGLASHPREGFADEGVASLKGYNLDKVKTVAEADRVRKSLNAENDAILQKNNYKIATARETDPGFAAREIASESLRDGIYKGLERRGIPGVRQLRWDEGSLIKLRNAAQNQYYNGAKTVSGSVNPGPIRKFAARATRLGSVAAGAEIAGPAGAMVGDVVGEEAGGLFTGKPLTRDQLAARSYKNRIAEPVKYPTLPPRPKIAGQLTAGPTITPYSDSSYVRSVPAEAEAGTRATRKQLLLQEGKGTLIPPYSDSSYVRAVPANKAAQALRGSELAKVPGRTPTTHLPDTMTASGTRRVTTAPKTPYSPPAEPPHPLLNAGERPLGAPPSPTAHGAPGPLQRLRNMAGETPEGASYPQKKTPPDVTRLNPATKKLEVWNGRKWGPVEAREGLVHDPEGPDVPEHKMYRKMSTDAGVEFMGMQEGGKTPWVLFRDPESGTTLGLRQSEFTPENIKKKIAASRASQPIRPKGMTPPPRTPTDDFDF